MAFILTDCINFAATRNNLYKEKTLKIYLKKKQPPKSFFHTSRKSAFTRKFK